MIGIDPVASRRKRAAAVGIEHTIGGTPEEVAAEVRRLTGDGVRIAVDAVGDSRVILQAAEMVVEFGDVVLLGTPRAPVQTNVTDLMSDIHGRWVNLRGAQEFRIPMKPVPLIRHSVQGNLETAFSLMVQGKLKLEPLISHRIPLDDAPAGCEELIARPEEALGVILRP